MIDNSDEVRIGREVIVHLGEENLRGQVMQDGFIQSRGGYFIAVSLNGDAVFNYFSNCVVDFAESDYKDVVLTTIAEAHGCWGDWRNCQVAADVDSALFKYDGLWKKLAKGLLEEY